MHTVPNNDHWKQKYKYRFYKLIRDLFFSNHSKFHFLFVKKKNEIMIQITRYIYTVHDQLVMRIPIDQLTDNSKCKFQNAVIRVVGVME